MKKVMNTPETYVRDELEGLVLAYPHILRLDPKWNNVYRKHKKAPDKVALVCGGGSGHEPMHAGFVGYGMLDGASAGAVFTSPTVPQVYANIKEVATDAGVLVVIKNYAGDVMNFKAAAQMANKDGIKTEIVITNDDIAVPEPANRRGTDLTIVTYKVAGAAAEEGLSLKEVKRVAEKVIANGRRLGFTLTPCTVPQVGKPTFELAEDEMELGIGIHGEKGIKRVKLMKSRDIAKYIIEKILEELKFGPNDEAFLMVNGQGSLPPSELFILAKDAFEVAKEHGVKIWHAWVGTFCTSLEMHGGAISLLKVDEELKRYILFPALVPANLPFNQPPYASV
ncbi:MAG: dihydroxyacetone kinase subunit DhaK [Candidatus Njordarchaeum guaymaensis]